MNLVITTSIIIYLLISLYFGKNWLDFFKSYATPNPANYFLSLIVLVIISISWPLAICLYLITSLSGFVAKQLFSAKRKNTNLHQSIPAVTLTATPIYQSEKI